jgi:hypothetical protein
MERRFTLADGMILMAGLGVGLALLKFAELDRELVKSLDRLMTSWMVWSPWDFVETIEALVLIIGLPLGAGLTPCGLYFQTRGRPGYVACLIATALIAPSLAIVGLMAALTGSPPKDYVPKLLLSALLAGAAIVASWLTMRWFGVWKPEPVWYDRLGRTVGIMWIVMGAMSGYFVLSVLR